MSLLVQPPGIPRSKVERKQRFAERLATSPAAQLSPRVKGMEDEEYLGSLSPRNTKSKFSEPQRNDSGDSSR